MLGEEDEVLILRVDELVAAEVGQAVDDAGQDHRASAVRGEPEAAWFARVAAEAAGPQWRAVLVEAGEVEIVSSCAPENTSATKSPPGSGATERLGAPPLKALRLHVLQVAQEGRQLEGSARRISQLPLHDQITNHMTLLNSLPFDPGWLRLPQFVTELEALARRRLYGYGLLHITLIKRDTNLHVSVLPDNSPRNVTSIPDDLHGEVPRGLSRVALPLDSPAMPDLAPRRHVDGNLSVIGLQ